MSDFTPTQGRYLSFIAMYIANFGHPPSEVEIADGLQVSSTSVNRMLKMLTQKGLIERKSRVARSIKLLIDPNSLPQWTSEGSSHIVMLRVQTPPVKKVPGLPNRAGKGAQPELISPSRVYRFKVVLDRTRPPIWRRIEVLDCSLAQFHGFIQSAMGWCDCHLHAFEIDKKLYYSPDLPEHLDPLDETYEGLTIGELVEEFGPKLKMKYWYDFGDDWWHTLTLEAVVEARPNTEYPRCTGGALCCPPEDVGGVGGFYQYLAIISDPDDSEHEETLEWRGEFDPEEFDVQHATNQMQQSLLPFED